MVHADLGSGRPDYSLNSMANRTKRTSKKENQFLATLRETGCVRKACEIVAIGRSTAYEWREEDEAFAKQWEDAVQDGLDLLEHEARRRAFDGLVRKKFTKGGDPIIDPETQAQYFEREYSDTLLIFLLKGGRPEKYRERYEHSGPGGTPLNAPPSLTVVIDDRRQQQDAEVTPEAG